MERNVWVKSCESSQCVKTMWVSACSTGGCVKVAWKCGGGECVAVGHLADRVLVRDGKLGEESPVLEFTPSGWRGFCAVAAEWDRSSVFVSGIKLGGSAEHVCLASTDDQVHLHFTWQEWDEFVEGVRAGKFDLEAQP